MRAGELRAPFAEQLACLVIDDDVVCRVVREQDDVPFTITGVLSSSVPQPGTTRYLNSPCPSTSASAALTKGKPATIPAALV
jgi:hypothetical protein